MSYPPPTYHGDGGETTARFRPVDTPPELPRPSGAANYLATGATTDGRFGLYRWDMGPEPGGAQPHFHRTFSESFFVLSGTVQLYDGKGWLDAEPGDFDYVPEGGIHGFRNESGRARVAADPVRARRSARGVLRGAGRDGRGALEAEPRGAAGVPRGARQHLHLGGAATAPSSSLQSCSDTAGVACDNCGVTLPATAKFCLECGTPRASVPDREVRKTVTLLFTDVTGSTALGEQLDPESYRGVMSRYFAVSRAAVERAWRDSREVRRRCRAGGLRSSRRARGRRRACGACRPRAAARPSRSCPRSSMRAWGSVWRSAPASTPARWSRGSHEPGVRRDRRRGEHGRAARASCRTR